MKPQQVAVEQIIILYALNLQIVIYQHFQKTYRIWLMEIEGGFIMQEAFQIFTDLQG